MTQPVTCGFCGYEFNPDQAQTACTACPLARGCHLICCALLQGWYTIAGKTRPKLTTTKAQEAVNQVITLLCQLQPGQEGYVAYLQTIFTFA